MKQPCFISTRFVLLFFLLSAGNPAAMATDYIPEKIDINRADTTVFKALPGIGSKLAKRIVDYREKLGGFYSVEQVSETYGLKDSTWKKIRKWLVLEDSAIRKININRANEAELMIPYIERNIAHAIVQYRRQHGAFRSVEDLKQIMIITEEWFSRVKPYLVL